MKAVRPLCDSSTTKTDKDIWTWLRADLDKACRNAIAKPNEIHGGAYPAALLMGELERRGVRDVLGWRKDNLRRLRREMKLAAARNGCVILPIRSTIIFAPRTTKEHDVAMLKS